MTANMTNCWMVKGEALTWENAKVDWVRTFETQPTSQELYRTLGDFRLTTVKVNSTHKVTTVTCVGEEPFALV